jgi:hypothetical protein
MFYEVRIFNAQKALKKIISKKELSCKYWKEFEENQKGFVSKKIQDKSSVPIKNI